MKNLTIWILAVSLMVTVASQFVPLKPDDAWHKKSVEVHNRFRRSAWPQAANMVEMVWNETLAKLAQKAADRCDGFHSSKIPGYETFGENIFGGGSTDVEEWALLWFNERDDYNHITGECSTEKVCGHYAMMARDIAKQVGCGMQRCPNYPEWTYGYCIYNRGAKNPPYTIGTPCSRCENDNQPPSDQYSIRTSKCFNGLCIQEGQEGGRNPTCKRTCVNCGQLNPDTCLCDCKSGYSGPSCDEVSKGPPTPTPCTFQCQKLGLTCLNGGRVIDSTTDCACNCSAGFTGKLCENNEKQIKAGITFKLRGRIYQERGVLIDTSTFVTDIQPKLASALASKVNEYCQRNQSVFLQCCPNAVPPVVPQPVVDPTKGVMNIDGFPRILGMSGDLDVGLFAKISLSNCRDTEELPGNIFFAALQELDWPNTSGLKEYGAIAVNVTKTTTDVDAPTTTVPRTIAPTTTRGCQERAVATLWYIVLVNILALCQVF